MALYTGRILVRKGNEADYDPDKLMPGEWALSTDKKIIRICVAAGVCIRMATYDAFEEDMAKIEGILQTCQTIQEAVVQINEEVSTNADAVVEYTAQAKQYRDEAKQYRDEAFATTPDGYESLVQNVADNTVKIDTVIEKAELNIKNTASGEVISLTDSSDNKVVEFALYGKAKQDGEPTPYTPIEIEVAGSSGSVVVTSCGKNYVDLSKFTSGTGDGVTITNRGDGSCLVTGTATGVSGNIWMAVDNTNGVFTLKKGKTYIIKDCRLYSFGIGLDGIIKATEDYVITGVRNAYFEVGKAYNEVIYPMVCELEYDDGTWESYKETTSTILTPNGLAGIPVDSDGNYADSDGQQRVCDEIVKYADGSGEYVQRVGKKLLSEATGITQETINNITRFNIKNVLNGMIAKATWLMCNIFINDISPASGGSVDNSICGYNGGATAYVICNFYSDVESFTQMLIDTNAYVLYALADPIRTPLTAEEIAEIEKLHTFYSVTNISNDSDCGMEVTYLADSKIYIDNKITDLATLMMLGSEV